MAAVGTARSDTGWPVRSVSPSTSRRMPMQPAGPTVGLGVSARVRRSGRDLLRAIPVPENAFLRSSGYDWQCDRGYRQDRETCVPIVLPDNAYLTDDHLRLRLGLRARFHGQFRAPAFRLRFPRTAISPMRTTVTNGPAKGASLRSMAVAIPWRFRRTPFWTRIPTGRDGVASGALQERKPPASRSTCPQTRISIDPETAGAATAAFSSRMGSAFLDDKAPRSDHGDAPGIRMRIGCRLKYRLTQPTPLIAMLNVHYSRFGDLERADYLVTQPSVPLESYRDGFGNWCTRMVAPAGDFTLSTDGIFRDTGQPDPVAPDATARGSGSALRDARSIFSAVATATPIFCRKRRGAFSRPRNPGWARVQAICDFVHGHVRVRLHAGERDAHRV
jgi:hypothetical protein